MSSVTRVSPTEAQRLVEDGSTYVDVRTEAEFAEGHPKGALNVPFMLRGRTGLAPNPRFLEVMRALFAGETKLVLGCKTGSRSLKAANALAAAGFTSVVDQRAGWAGARDPFGDEGEPGWSQLDLPSEAGATPGATYAELLAKIVG